MAGRQQVRTIIRLPDTVAQTGSGATLMPFTDGVHAQVAEYDGLVVLRSVIDIGVYSRDPRLPPHAPRSAAAFASDRHYCSFRPCNRRSCSLTSDRSRAAFFAFAG